MDDKIVLLDLWDSYFAMRARIALAEKGVKYEQKEEDLLHKSPLLLEMNPVHKLIPVLIHDGKPICESLIIVEYIDEVFNDRSPLLPSDPYQRSQARFWADYVDKKVYSCAQTLWKEKGEELEKGKKDLIEGLKTLEGELGNKTYFGGETFGFVDVALLPITSWFYTFGILGNFSIEPECPKIMAWAKRCMQRESASKTLPDPHKIYDSILQLRKLLGVD